MEVFVSGTFTYAIDPFHEVVHVTADLDVQGAHYPLGPREKCPFHTFPIPATLSQPVENTYEFQGRRGLERGSERTAYDTLRDRPGWALALSPAQCNSFQNRVAHQRLTYSFYGGPPRSLFEVRTSAAFFLFPIELFGDPGKINIVVTVPEDYIVDSLGPEWTKTTENGTTTYVQLGVADPEGFSAVVSARNDALLRRGELTTDDQSDFLLQYWTGDEEWSSLVTDGITRTLPALVTAVGRPWPFATAVDVREMPAAALTPEAAWTRASEQLFEASESADNAELTRELAHAWFNDEWFSEQWIADGFAAVYAEVAMPGSAPEVQAAPAASLPLAEWTATADGEEGDASQRSTAQWVVQELLDEIGPDAMGDVLTGVDSGITTYAGEGVPESWNETTGWRHLLDLLEDIGGSRRAAELLRQYVIPPADMATLDDRSAARAAYDALETDGAGWAPPTAVRQALDSWEFDEALAQIKAAQRVLALRQQLAELAAAAGYPPPSTLEGRYETAADLAEVEAMMEELVSTARILTEAARVRDGHHGLLGGLGLIEDDLAIPMDEAGDAFTAGDLATARASAQAVIDTGDQSTQDGMIRLALVGLALALAGTLIVWLRRRRPAADTSSVEIDPPGDPEPPELSGDPGATLNP